MSRVLDRLKVIVDVLQPTGTKVDKELREKWCMYEFPKHFLQKSVTRADGDYRYKVLRACKGVGKDGVHSWDG